MAFHEIANVELKGIAACVPAQSYKISEMGLFSENEAIRFSESTGVYNLRISSSETTTSDLVYHAAEQLIVDLKWNKEEVDLLIFVTQTPDYVLPATSCILQSRLGLKQDTFVLDISLGCSGWIYGLLTISNLISTGSFKKGLLLVGDTISKTCSSKDKSTFPLFGDGGTATAIEYNVNCESLKFQFGVDGSGSNAIIIPDGGFRSPFSKNSFISKKIDEGIIRAPKDLILEGMDVFSFGITKASQSISSLIEKFKIDRDSVDYYLFHQANLFMNEKIRKKLKIPEEKVPYSLRQFGNTSSATIPLTLTTQIGDELKGSTKEIIACGFGVGLTWGSVWLKTNNLVCSSLIEI
ncbi:MAG: ketoacyl-ACP synthase III [Mangrovibacterium sp.]